MTEIDRLSVSPFSTGKWEYESTLHFFYLESDEYSKLAQTRKHCFLVGHRGTGKTTLLKALDWEERIQNTSLYEELDGKPFNDGIVGAYITLKEASLTLFDDWLCDSNRSVYHIIVSSYLRAICLQEAAKAVRHISKSMPNYSLLGESQVTNSIGEEFFEWAADVLTIESVQFGTEVKTFRSIEQIASLLSDYLFDQATFTALSPESIMAALRLRKFQGIVNRLFLGFANYLSSLSDDRLWHFRLCLDEGEYLSDRAKMSVRTMVRECESPMYLIVSALRDLGTSTISDGVDLTLDDRHVINLDNRGKAEMQNLIQGIAKVRLKAAGIPTPSFQLRSLLGKPDLNELLLAHKPGENGRYRDFVRHWPKYEGEPLAFPRGRPSPIRNYLEMLGVIEDSREREISRHEDSIGFRKFKLAGYLHLLHELGFDEPLYAGSDIATGMSDGSIRDFILFLEFCREEWWLNKSGKQRSSLLDREAVEGFINQESIPWQLQDNALKRLGVEKLDAFEGRVLHSHESARRVVEFFSILAGYLDREGLNSAPKRPLRSRFLLTLDQKSSKLDDADVDADKLALQEAFLQLVSECSEEGFLRIAKYQGSNGELQVRVHLSLARQFNFAYQRPQYSTRIEWSDIERVMTDSSLKSLDRMAHAILEREKFRIARKANIQEDQLPLEYESSSDESLDQK
jgi:energy-coupling factor transporter ATP-binding protein EcfA2